MAPRPLFMTETDLPKYYPVDSRKAAEIVETLDPVGVHTGNTLYSRYDVEAKIKEGK